MLVLLFLQNTLLEVGVKEFSNTILMPSVKLGSKKVALLYVSLAGVRMSVYSLCQLSGTVLFGLSHLSRGEIEFSMLICFSSVINM